jgi:hypothetical protein
MKDYRRYAFPVEYVTTFLWNEAFRQHTFYRIDIYQRINGGTDLVLAS